LIGTVFEAKYRLEQKKSLGTEQIHLH